MNRDEAEIRAIDARIEAALTKQRDFGTVAARDPIGAGAMVTFDNTSVAQPVKVAGHVHCAEGDRVFLELFKTTWIVMGTFSRRELGQASFSSSGPSGAANTGSATFVDMPSTTTMTMTKRYDDTLMQYRLQATMWTNTANTAMQGAVRVQGTPGTDTAVTFTAIDITLGFLEFDTVGVRTPVHGQNRATDIPAGEYTLTARWRKAAGAGVVIMDSLDLVTLEADERFTG